MLDGLASTVDGATLVDYRWTLGDGAVASGAQIQHVYEQPGRYPLRLWVRDDSGRLREGFAAWRVIMTELPGWRWLAKLVAAPPLCWLGPPIYRMIAKNRSRLSMD